MGNISGFNQFFANFNRICIEFHKIQANLKEVKYFFKICGQ